MEFDMIIHNGLIVSDTTVLPLGNEIGVKNGKISCIGMSLPSGPKTERVDAEGAYITPGGVDAHVHLAQTNAPTGDTWKTGSRSAIAGGTTTILAFASQKRTDTSLIPVLDDYYQKARGQSYADYGFHFILTNPTRDILQKELPIMANEKGVTSVKLYMTYEPMKLTDRDLLDIMISCSALGLTTMIHAENSDMIALIIEGLERNGNTDPFYHAIARPRIAEDEASYRAISLAELVGAPILIVHMSSKVAVEHVRHAQARLLPIHAETCPHYLFLLSENLKRHRVEDLEDLWQGIANGTFTVFSSDHAPSKYDHPGGKKLGLVNGIPMFSKIPNGLPGVETRLALLFSESEACLPPAEARLSLPRFVQLTSTNPAKMYGLGGCKGSILPGYDADFVIWYPTSSDQAPMEITQKMLHHGVDYTPFEGVKIRNWPRYTILRGKIVWNRDSGKVLGEMTYGQYLKRGKGKVLVGKSSLTPRGMLDNERDMWMPKR
ncbi:hypothetical protein CLAIMM_01226 [Cladophialophora immunda]|nr:hypothetical protein CLAIMM_01226 [Cladophialophora immunda]